MKLIRLIYWQPGVSTFRNQLDGISATFHKCSTICFYSVWSWPPQQPWNAECRVCVLFAAFHSTTDCFTSAMLYLFLARHEHIKANSSQRFSEFLNLFTFFSWIFFVVGLEVARCIDSVIKSLHILSTSRFRWLFISLKQTYIKKQNNKMSQVLKED